MKQSNRTDEIIRGVKHILNRYHQQRVAIALEVAAARAINESNHPYCKSEEQNNLLANAHRLRQLAMDMEELTRLMS